MSVESISPGASGRWLGLLEFVPISAVYVGWDITMLLLGVPVREYQTIWSQL